jgi:hypothetical protein
MSVANIDISTLRQLLAYNPETGALTWLNRSRDFFPTLRAWAIWNGRYAGKEAFTCNAGGYRTGNLFNRRTKAHRVAYALYHGEWPDSVDHINGDTADNRIANLRSVDHQTNMRNQKKRSTNTSGVTGVVRFRAKWKAQIADHGKNRNLGHFDSFDEAVAARKAAERRLGFHANHGVRS